MKEKETRNFHDLIKEKMEKDGPAIYKHLGFEHQHLMEMIEMSKQDDTIEFSHDLYLPEYNEDGVIVSYVHEDNQRFIGHLKRKYKDTHVDRLKNMTFKNVFYFENHPNVFEQAKTDQLPFLIVTSIKKKGE